MNTFNRARVTRAPDKPSAKIVIKVDERPRDVATAVVGTDIQIGTVLRRRTGRTVIVHIDITRGVRRRRRIHPNREHAAPDPPTTPDPPSPATPDHPPTTPTRNSPRTTTRTPPAPGQNSNPTSARAETTPPPYPTPSRNSIDPSLTTTGVNPSNRNGNVHEVRRIAGLENQRLLQPGVERRQLQDPSPAGSPDTSPPNPSPSPQPPPHPATRTRPPHPSANSPTPTRHHRTPSRTPTRRALRGHRHIQRIGRHPQPTIPPNTNVASIAFHDPSAAR